MTTSDLIEAEHRLQAAQRSSDVDALAALLHPELIAVAWDGSTVDRESDLAGHRAGIYETAVFEHESLEARVAGDTGVTLVVIRVEATIDGQPFAGRLRYLRTWTRAAGSWQVLAAHIAMLDDAPA